MTICRFLCSNQKRRGQPNPKSNSEKFIPDEDGGSGFLIEPTKGITKNDLSHSGKTIHPSALGYAQNMDVTEDEVQMGSARGSNSRIHKSYSHRGASQLSMFSGSVAVRGSSRFDNDRENGVNRHWPEERCNGRCIELSGAESSEKQQLSHHLLERPKSSHKKDEQLPEKEPSMMVKKFSKILIDASVPNSFSNHVLISCGCV